MYLLVVGGGGVAADAPIGCVASTVPAAVAKIAIVCAIRIELLLSPGRRIRWGSGDTEGDAKQRYASGPLRAEREERVRRERYGRRRMRRAASTPDDASRPSA